MYKSNTLQRVTRFSDLDTSVTTVPGVHRTLICLIVKEKARALRRGPPGTVPLGTVPSYGNSNATAT
jgi:hypothetical protein